MLYMNKKTADVSTRITPDQLAKRSMDSRLAAMEQALKVKRFDTNLTVTRISSRSSLRTDSQFG
jgi:hypothetical protein